MDCAPITIFEHSHQVCLCGFLQSKHCQRLKSCILVPVQEAVPHPSRHRCNTRHPSVHDRSTGHGCGHTLSVCGVGDEQTEGGQLLPGSVIRHYRRGHLVLPGVLPGVTWSVTWCYLECYLGVAMPDVTWVFILEFLCFLWSQNVRVPQTQTSGQKTIST